MIHETEKRHRVSKILEDAFLAQKVGIAIYSAKLGEITTTEKDFIILMLGLKFRFASEASSQVNVPILTP